LTSLLLKKVINAIPPKTEETIINTTIALRNNGVKGYADIGYRLNQIARNCDINNPEAVKSYIANAKTQRTNKPIEDSTKNRLLYCYNEYCRINGIQWKKPYYKVEEKTPLIPTSQNVDLIISNASKKYAPIFTILAEIGCSPIELSNTTQNHTYYACAREQKKGRPRGIARISFLGLAGFVGLSSSFETPSARQSLGK